MKLSARVRIIDKSTAELMLLQYKYEHQRKIAPQTVKKYVKIMTRGDWQRGTQIALAVYNDKKYLMNGQHRLQAIAETGIETEVSITEYDFSDTNELAAIEGMAKLYATIDTLRARTPSDALKACEIARKIGVSDSVVTAASAALKCLYSNGYTDPKKISTWSNIEMADLIAEWGDAIRDASYLCTGKGTRLLGKFCTGAVLSVALVSYRYTDRADEFWRKCYENDGLKKGTPEHTLVSYLANYPLSSEPRPLYVRKVCCAWNAYYECRPLSVLKVYAPTAPLLIAGTPYNGKA